MPTQCRSAMNLLKNCAQ